MLNGGKPGKDNLFSLIFLYDSFVHNFFLNIMFLVFQVAQGKMIKDEENVFSPA